MSERPISRRTMDAIGVALDTYGQDEFPLIETLQKRGAISQEQGSLILHRLQEIETNFPHAAFNELRIDLLVLLWRDFAKPSHSEDGELHTMS
jgi:hypothetical protein